MFDLKRIENLSTNRDMKGTSELNAAFALRRSIFPVLYVEYLYLL